MTRWSRIASEAVGGTFLLLASLHLVPLGWRLLGYDPRATLRHAPSAR